MKTAAEVLDKQNFQQLRETANSQSNAVEIAKRTKAEREPIMERLWERMVETYGNAFTSQFGDIGETGFDTWVEGLADIPVEGIRRGFIKAVKSGSPYPPNLVTFRTYCIDFESIGLPSPDAAFDMAAKTRYWQERQKLPPAVYHAGADTGWFELRASSDIVRLRRVFAEHYAKRIDQVMSGVVLHMPEFRQERMIEQKPASPSFAKQQIANIRKLLGS